MRAAVASLLALACLAPAAPGQSSRRGQGPVTYPHDVYLQDVVWGHLLEGKFKEVSDVFFDTQAGELYVADSKNSLIGIYDPDGVPLFAFGGRSVLVDPRVVEVGQDGTIYVLDAEASRLKAFNYRGEPRDAVVFPAPDSGPAIERIGTFALGPDGSWYVADAELPRVVVYGPDLELRHVLPRPDDVGRLDRVTGLAVSKQGLVAVLDYRETPVQVFDAKGRFVSGFGSRDIGRDSFASPMAVAFDDEGYLFVVDMLRHDVKIFDQQGNHQASFGGWFSPTTRGRGPGEMLYPSGIALAPGGAVYVSERYGNRVQLFERRPHESAEARRAKASRAGGPPADE